MNTDTNEQQLNKIIIKMVKLPEKLRVQYLFNCILDIKSFIETEEAFLILEKTELWLQGKINLKEIKKVANYYNAFNSADLAVFYFGPNTFDTESEFYNDRDFPYDSMNVIKYICKVLNVSAEVYDYKLIQFINNLSETEKIVYGLKSEI